MGLKKPAWRLAAVDLSFVRERESESKTWATWETWETWTREGSVEILRS